MLTFFIFGAWIVSLLLGYFVILFTRKVSSRYLKVTLRVILIAFLLIPSFKINIYPLPPPLYIQVIDQFNAIQEVDLEEYSVSGRVVNAKTDDGMSDAHVVVLWEHQNNHNNICVVGVAVSTDSNGYFEAKPIYSDKYKLRKRIKSSSPLVIAYKSGYYGEVLTKAKAADGNVATLNLYTDKKKTVTERVNYLDHLAHRITCSNFSTLVSDVYKVKLMVYEEARKIAKTKEQLDLANEICLSAVSEKVGQQHRRSTPVELEAVVRREMKNLNCE